MDTKSQNSIISLVGLISILFLVAFACVSCFEKKLDFDEENVSYFRDSPEINNDVIRYAKNLQRYYIYYNGFDIDRATLKLSEIDNFISTEKITPQQRNFRANTQPFSSDDESDEAADSGVFAENPEELYDFDIDDVTVEELITRQTELSDAINNYKSIENYILSNDEFHYSLYSNILFRVIATNTNNFYQEGSYEIISISDPLFSIKFNNEILNSSFTDRGLKLDISIPVTTSAQTRLQMAMLMDEIKYNKVFSSPLLPMCLLALAALIASYLYLCQDEKTKEILTAVYSYYSKIPFIFTFPLAVILIVFIIQHGRMYRNLLTVCISNDRYFMLMVTILISCFAVLFFSLFLSNVINVLRNPRILYNSPMVKIISSAVQDIKLALQSKKYILTGLLFFDAIIILWLVGIMFVSLLSVNVILKTFLIYVASSISIIIFSVIFKAIVAEIKLRYYIAELADGSIDAIPVQTGLFSEPINNINRINTSLRNNMNEILKSERLKTELITNVSHDLKTPLTSIISYVSLLKDMDIDNKVAEEYISVIDNKSRRLKILIDDLFEASKLSSGQMKLDRMYSDIVALLNQALGELSYKIEESGIDFIVSTSSPSILVNMDGQKMWRVFDNLINNILKYSARGSRAYVDIKEEEKAIIITFKNVANYSMDFEANELFERFKRGDASRSTEGSGLGLSIAKSIVELHGGMMNISTDGDLFKITILLSKQ